MNQTSNISFWEKEHFTNYDFIVIGSGIVGLSTAITALEFNPDLNVLILERGLFPSGASTKNAGFACFGSVSELLEDLDKMEEQAVVELVKQRWEGLSLLRRRLGDDSIDFQQYGGYELLFDDAPVEIDALDKLNKLLFPLFGENVYHLADDKIEALGFNPDKVKHLIFNKIEGQIDTGKMMKALLKKAQLMGATLLTGATVTKYQEKNEGVELSVESLSQNINIKGQKLAICTNAFIHDWFPKLDLNPGRGQVLVTNPIANLKIKGTFHYDAGYYYFRNIGNRIIFGGARNVDFDTETTTDIALNDKIQQKLEEDLKAFIIPNQHFTIDHKWAGIMGFGLVKKPIIKQLGERIVIGVRLGGMGVAIGSSVGQEVAHLIVNDAMKTKFAIGKK